MNLSGGRTRKVLGCTQAWTPEVFKTFGGIPTQINNVNEDYICNFRSVLLGYVVYIDVPLVRYRRHDTNVSVGSLTGQSVDMTSFRSTEEKRLRTLNRFASAFACLAHDLQTAHSKGLISESQFHTVDKAIAREREIRSHTIQCVKNPGLSAILPFSRLILKGVGPRSIMAHLPYLLPHSIFSRATIACDRFRRWRSTK